MPELRQDELTGRWVLLAPDRSARPHTVVPAPAAPSPPTSCPFCPGHEERTPPEVYRTGEGDPDASGWRVRVVPNLYPVVGGADAGPGATGAHEVAILSPAHDHSFAQLDDNQAADVLTVLRDRTRFHLAQGRVYVQTLINHGRSAGASIEHPHAQIVALDVVPPAVEASVARFRRHGPDLVRRDAAATDAGEELGVIAGPAPVWCPAGASTAYEFRTAFAPRSSRFDQSTDDEVTHVAVAARDALRRLSAVLGDAPYNLIVHTAPADADSFHWYVEVQPRIGVVAGFELGTGMFVSTMSPGAAARQLREVEVATR